MLVPAQAPYLQGAKLLISADCVPFAEANFHSTYLKDRVLMIGCPKLDDSQFYQEKLTQVFAMNDIESVEVLFMEVPCCMGLVSVVKQAVVASGKDVPGDVIRIGIQGGEISRTPLADLPF